MTDMQEKVARAICKAESAGMGRDQTCDCDGKTDSYQVTDGRGRKHQRKRPCPYLNEAEAAIEAMRSPTNEMLLVGARSIGKTMGVANHIERSRPCWQGMIDEALGHEET